MENQMQPRQQAGVPSTHVNHAQVLRTDILVPYVVIAQAMSESVQERKAQMGDIVKSTNFEKLGDPDHPLEVIYLHYPKSNWVIEQKPKGGGRFEYRKTIPRDASNELLPWTFWADDDGNECQPTDKGASEWRRTKQLLVFAILPRDIEAAQAEMAKVEKGELPDPNKALTPVLLSFRSTSYKAGKEVCTFFTQAASMKVPIWKYTLPLGCTFEQNDEGKFYTWKVDRNKTKAVPKDQLVFVEEWVGMLTSVNLKADDAADSESYQAARPVTQVNPNAGDVV